MSLSSELKSNLLGSSTAGIIARLICHPIDTVKSRLQSGRLSFGSEVIQTFRNTYKNEGIASLYRGLSATIFGGVPGVCIYLTSYDKSKTYLSENPFFKDSPFAVYFSSGMIAEILCCIVFVPVDVVKERLQCQIKSNAGVLNSNTSLPHYKGSLDAIIKIVKQEGISGIYKGYNATLLAYGPFSALYFLFYEELKSKYGTQNTSKNNKNNSINNNQIELSFQQSLGFSAIAGAAASYITNPLDMIKLRLQIERGCNIHDITYRSLFSKVYQAEGIRGLYRGATARVLFHAPSTAITMATYEVCKKWWENFFEDNS